MLYGIPDGRIGLLPDSSHRLRSLDWLKNAIFDMESGIGEIS